MFQLLVGLGNPGDRYRNTRHNFGFLLLDSFNLQFKNEKKFKAEIATTIFAGQKVTCLKPQTFMNLSGDSVASYLNFYQIAPEACLVVHDELDLAFGDVRLKQGGGDGGHNGLKSVTASLGTSDYGRLRYGIGKPGPGRPMAVEDWVLSRFSADEQGLMAQLLREGREAVEQVAKFGFAKAQSLFNGRAKASS